MEAKPVERRKRLKVWISDEERALLDSKAAYYHYHSLSEYIRDACLYEKVTYVDYKNRDVLDKAYSENTEELQKIVKDIRHICTFATQISPDEVKGIMNILAEVYRRQREMLTLIEKKLDLEVWQKRNYNLY